MFLLKQLASRLLSPLVFVALAALFVALTCLASRPQAPAPPARPCACPDCPCGCPARGPRPRDVTPPRSLWNGVLGELPRE